MIPYILILAIPALIMNTTSYSSVNGYKQKHEDRNKLAIGCFFACVLIMVCFRAESMGADTKQYRYHFDEISKLDWSELRSYGYELGFVFIYKLAHSIFGSYRGAMIMVAVITILPASKVYCQDGEYPYLKIILFAMSFFGLFSGGRQGMAEGVIWLSYPLIQQKKLWKFLFAVCIATLFHQSALFALLLYPTYHFKIKKTFFPVCLGCMAGVFVLRRQIFSVMIQFAGEKFIERYSTMASTGAYGMLALYVLLSCFMWLIVDDKKRDKEVSGLMNIFLLATGVQMFTSIAHGMSRVNSYYAMFLPLVLPRVFSCTETKYKKIAKTAYYVLCIFFTMYYFFMVVRGAAIYNIFPYEFGW